MRSAVCKFKRHIQKSGVFLHTSNEHADTGIKSTISFATAQKKKEELLRNQSNKACTGLVC